MPLCSLEFRCGRDTGTGASSSGQVSVPVRNFPRPGGMGHWMGEPVGGIEDCAVDWAVVGAGPQGVHLALVLHRRLGVPLERLVLLDPKPPLTQWRQRGQQVAMDVLRSPIVHHVDLDAMSLHRFWRSHRAPAGAFVAGPYDRPSANLFDAHCDAVLAASGLLLRWRPWRVTGLHRGGSVSYLHTDAGDVRARRVLLALGSRPASVRFPMECSDGDFPVAHCLDDGFDRDAFAGRVRERGGRVAIVGMGTSGVGLARHWAREGLAVTLVGRRPPGASEFDTDPCWHGPKCLDGFEAERSRALRRLAVDGARRRGSLPPDQLRSYDRDRGAGRIAQQLGELAGLRAVSSEPARLVFANGRELEIDGLVFATGLCPERPGGAWLDRAIDELELPTAPCGYPILRRDLHWGAGVYAAGALAELELGPVARNISGARLAGERLAHAAGGRRRRVLATRPGKRPNHRAIP